ncbi:MAG: signal peptide peptidase SppA [Candidatus Babeliales bacterium]
MAKITDYLKTIFFVLILLQIAPPLLHSIKKQYFDALKPHTKVAYLPINGMVSNSSHYIKYLKKFYKNPEIKAILVKIESSGTTAGSAEAIANEIEFYKKKYPKPIIVLTENICASGAYLIAATTDHVIASPSTIIGSIGTTIPNQFKVKNFLAHHNITYESIKTGDYKDSTNPFTNPTQEELVHLEGITHDSYQTFIEHVARNRKRISLAKAPEWANGKLFTGKQALQNGLVDELGSLSNAIAYLKKAALIEEKIEWIKPSESARGWLGYFMGQQDPTEDASSPLEGMIRKALLSCAIK